MRVSPETSTVTAGETRQFTATFNATNCSPTPTVQWSSSVQSVATVSATGLVTTLAPGRTNILASALGEIAVGALTVSAPSIATISLTPATATLTVGSSAPLAAVVRDNAGNVLTGRILSWSSLSPGVASVSQGGVVTAVSAGTATISVTSEGRSATAAVTVTPVPVSSIVLTPAAGTVQPGSQLPLTATVRDAAGNVLSNRTVVWSSGTPTLASVSTTGVVTGIAPGAVIITATSEGVSATVAITVTSVPVNSIAITPASGTVLVATFLQLTATLRDASNNVLTGRTVTWTSSMPDRATVSSGGYVVGVTTGPVTITA
ncbi:Ig-like domain-containing protein, partial [Gemmatimonas sp.]|uniref:Ig-like domain-containing protein n=1 Tax=Gemmatimonas sp. TaxID=1962908 RepID=UPI00286A6801